MEPTIITSANIRAYIEGKLDGEALGSFQQALQDDSALRRTVNMIQGMYQSGKTEKAWEELDSLSEFVQDEEALNRGKQKLNELLQNMPEEVKVVPLYRRAWFQAAAAVLLFIVGLLWLYPFSQSPAVMVYEPVGFESDFTPVGADELYDMYQTGLVAYNEDNDSLIHELAARTKKMYPYEVEYMPRLQLMSAVAYFDNQDYKRAEQLLNNFLAPNDEKGDEIKHKADYYHAMSLYKLDRKQEALSILKTLSQEADKQFLEEYEISKWLNYLN